MKYFANFPPKSESTTRSTTDTLRGTVPMPAAWQSDLQGALPHGNGTTNQPEVEDSLQQKKEEDAGNTRDLSQCVNENTTVVTDFLASRIMEASAHDETEKQNINKMSLRSVTKMTDAPDIKKEETVQMEEQQKSKESEDQDVPETAHQEIALDLKCADDAEILRDFHDNMYYNICSKNSMTFMERFEDMSEEKRVWFYDQMRNDASIPGGMESGGQLSTCDQLSLEAMQCLYDAGSQDGISYHGSKEDTEMRIAVKATSQEVVEDEVQITDEELKAVAMQILSVDTKTMSLDSLMLERNEIHDEVREMHEKQNTFVDDIRKMTMCNCKAYWRDYEWHHCNRNMYRHHCTPTAWCDSNGMNVTVYPAQVAGYNHPSNMTMLTDEVTLAVEDISGSKAEMYYDTDQSNASHHNNEEFQYNCCHHNYNTSYAHQLNIQNSGMCAHNDFNTLGESYATNSYANESYNGATYNGESYSGENYTEHLPTKPLHLGTCFQVNHEIVCCPHFCAPQCTMLSENNSNNQYCYNGHRYGQHCSETVMTAGCSHHQRARPLGISKSVADVLAHNTHEDSSNMFNNNGYLSQEVKVFSYNQPQNFGYTQLPTSYSYTPLTNYSLRAYQQQMQPKYNDQQAYMQQGYGQFAGASNVSGNNYMTYDPNMGYNMQNMMTGMQQPQYFMIPPFMDGRQNQFNQNWDDSGQGSNNWAEPEEIEDPGPKCIAELGQSMFGKEVSTSLETLSAQQHRQMEYNEMKHRRRKKSGSRRSRHSAEDMEDDRHNDLSRCSSHGGACMVFRATSPTSMRRSKSADGTPAPAPCKKSSSESSGSGSTSDNVQAYKGRPKSYSSMVTCHACMTPTVPCGPYFPQAPGAPGTGPQGGPCGICGPASLCLSAGQAGLLHSTSEGYGCCGGIFGGCAPPCCRKANHVGPQCCGPCQAIPVPCCPPYLPAVPIYCRAMPTCPPGKEERCAPPCCPPLMSQAVPGGPCIIDPKKIRAEDRRHRARCKATERRCKEAHRREIRKIQECQRRERRRVKNEERRLRDRQTRERKRCTMEKQLCIKDEKRKLKEAEKERRRIAKTEDKARKRCEKQEAKCQKAIAKQVKAQEKAENKDRKRCEKEDKKLEKMEFKEEKRRAKEESKERKRMEKEDLKREKDEDKIAKRCDKQEKKERLQLDKEERKREKLEFCREKASEKMQRQWEKDAEKREKKLDKNELKKEKQRERREYAAEKWCRKRSREEDMRLRKEVLKNCPCATAPSGTSILSHDCHPLGHGGPCARCAVSSPPCRPCGPCPPCPICPPVQPQAVQNPICGPCQRASVSPVCCGMVAGTCPCPPPGCWPGGCTPEVRVLGLPNNGSMSCSRVQQQESQQDANNSECNSSCPGSGGCGGENNSTGSYRSDIDCCDTDDVADESAFAGAKDGAVFEQKIICFPMHQELCFRAVASPEEDGSCSESDNHVESCCSSGTAEDDAKKKKSSGGIMGYLISKLSKPSKEGKKKKKKKKHSKKCPPLVLCGNYDVCVPQCAPKAAAAVAASVNKCTPCCALCSKYRNSNTTKCCPVPCRRTGGGCSCDRCKNSCICSRDSRCKCGKGCRCGGKCCNTALINTEFNLGIHATNSNTIARVSDVVIATIDYDDIMKQYGGLD